MDKKNWSKTKQKEIASEKNTYQKVMYRKIAVSTVAAVFLALLYAVIFSFSAQDGEASGGLSRYIAEKCAEMFNSMSGKHWSQAVVEGWAAYWEHPIRKLAHFSEYACMGILVYVMLRPWKAGNKRLYLLVILWVALSAAGDEFHQLFVPGRYGSPADVLLDTCGGAFGAGLCLMAEYFQGKRRRSARRQKAH